MSFEEIYSGGDYSKENPNWHIEDSPWKSKEIIDMIDRHSLTPKSIAEVGCGVGGILECVDKKFSSVDSLVGYDISQFAIENAISRLGDSKINFFNKDILSDEVYFDLLLCIDVVEHLENPYDFLRRLKCKSDFKIFHFPLDMNALAVARQDRMLYAKNSVGHINYFTKDLALDILKDCGYEIIDYYYTTGSIKSKYRSFKNSLIKPIRILGFHLNKDLFVRLIGGYSLLILAK